MINNKYFYTIINMALFLQSTNTMMKSISSISFSFENNFNLNIDLNNVKGSVGLFPHQVTYDKAQYDNDEQYRKGIIEYTGNLVKRIDIKDFPVFFEKFTKQYAYENPYLMEIAYTAGAQKIEKESENIKKQLNQEELKELYKRFILLGDGYEYKIACNYRIARSNMLTLIASDLLDYWGAKIIRYSITEKKIKYVANSRLERFLNENLGADKVFNTKYKVLDLLEFLIPEKKLIKNN